MAFTAEDPQNRRPSATPEVQVDRQPTGKNAELLDSDDAERKVRVSEMCMILSCLPLASDVKQMTTLQNLQHLSSSEAYWDHLHRQCSGYTAVVT